MRWRGLAVVIASLVLSGCGASSPSGAPPSGPVSTGAGSSAAATSPTVSDEPMPSALPQRLVQRGRQFRGNPVPLAVITGAVLLAALGLGVFTIVLAASGRGPERD
jgi:hypothetical protein